MTEHFGEVGENHIGKIIKAKENVNRLNWKIIGRDSMSSAREEMMKDAA